MITQQLVEKAIQTAQSAQATLWQSESTEISFENDHLKSITPAQRTRISLKVILDGKVGRSNTTDVNDLDGVVERALQTARFGPRAHYEFTGPEKSSVVKTYDEKVTQFTTPQLVQMGQGMVDQVKAYNKEILVSAGVNKSKSEVEFSNSNGHSFTDKDTNFFMGVFGNLVRGTDILDTGHGKSTKDHVIDPEDLTDRAIEWFRLAERIAPLQTGHMPVIFTPFGMSVLMLSLFEGFNGKNVLLGESPLSSKLGEQIADPRFSVVDDPLVDYAPSSSRYDEEGVPRRRLALIEDGVAKNFLYDLDTAGRAGKHSTGHGVGCNPVQLVVKPGEVPYEQMIAGVKEGILVHQVMGLGQGNVINGEFSVNVHLGYKIENGKIVGRIKDVMLTGNVYEALKDIVAIGSQPEWVPDSFGFVTMYTPAVEIGSLNVVAK
jgi:PmbA protein